MPEYGPGQRVWRWLERSGFTDDPFAVYEADQERAKLPGLFIDRPYVTRVVGDPARPQSAFLLAQRGTGKTATREIVAYECTHGRFQRRALPVRYCDFSSLLERADGDPAHITVRHHVDAIVRVTLQTLAEDVPPTFFDLLSSAERALLLGLATKFANPGIRLRLGQLVSGDPVLLLWDDFSPSEILETIFKLALRLGQSENRRYEAVYVLIDRADETEFGAATLVPLLKPLVAASGLLSMPGVAFKFFLPLELGEQLLAEAVLRRDHFSVETITWDRTALQDMLKRRLVFHSNGRVEDLGQLCTAAARSNAVERLLARSQNSPRTLLRLCGTVVRYHLERTTDLLIDSRDISGALAEFDPKTTASPRQAPSSNASRSESTFTQIEPPAHGLFLDVGDNVWIDGVCLTPPLTNLEFRLLKTLFQAAPNEILSKEDLIVGVWDDPDAADEQSLRKLVGRLRERLEPNVTDKTWRFVQNRRGRGYSLSKE